MPFSYPTNELPAAANQNAAPPLGRAVAGGPAALATDDAAWLAALPAVEADPAMEAARREALARVEPPILRRTVGHATAGRDDGGCGDAAGVACRLCYTGAVCWRQTAKQTANASTA